jgi:type IV secretion system protein TrbG
VRNLALWSPTSSVNRKPVHLALLLTVALSGCTTFKPPQISYDDEVPPSPDLPMPTDDRARPLHVPPPWTPARGGEKGDQEAKEPTDRIGTANDAARVEPRRAGYFNAVQVFPYSPGALYQIYASPGQITDIALEPGEQLIGSGPLAAGDTVRWIVGDTESGNGDTRRVHIMVKPTRPAIETNLVVNTDRRTYLIELRSREKPYMPSVCLVLPGRPIRPFKGFATNSNHSGSGSAPLPLRHRGRQPAVASGQCLR